MIKKLSVSNYTLIDELHIDFSAGFSVITGETGAGKSIILGALSLILGQRADLKSLRRSDEKAVIEGVFDIASYHLRDFFDENELDYDEGECILRREILPSGKSRAFINDTPVSLAQLKTLGEQLIDIHSQHQNMLLADSRFQLRVVDTMAGDAALLADYREHYRRWRERLQAYTRLQEENRSGREEEDYLRYQLAQLDEAHLQEGEQEELEAELQTLQHAEEIKNELAVLQEFLHAEETGVVSLLNATLSRMRALSRLYPEVDEWAGRLESDYIDLKDIASTVDRSQENLNMDPERLAWVENRLDTYYSLQQKHRLASAAELLALRDSFAERLTRIENYDEELAALKHEVDEAESQVRNLAEQLTSLRDDLKNLSSRADESEGLLREAGVSGTPEERSSGLEGARQLSLDVSNTVSSISELSGAGSAYDESASGLLTLANWLRNRCDALTEAWERAAASEDPSADRDSILAPLSEAADYARLFSEEIDDWSPSTSE